jgi:hypothetical protein
MAPTRHRRGRPFPDTLILITRAAITGATLHAPPSRHTQRYQQLASTVIVACHTTGQPVPAGFLAGNGHHRCDRAAVAGVRMQARPS